MMAEALTFFNFDSNLTLLNECDYSEDFVAISSLVDNDSNCTHSGLVICQDEEIHYFHYTGKVELINITENVKTKKMNPIYQRKLDIISPHDVLMFLGHCEKLIQQGISPIYGFVFNDSYYDSITKEHFVKEQKHDITTCVGFCIKVIRGFLWNNTEYLKLSDWNNQTISTVPKERLDKINLYLENYAKLHKIKIEDLYKQNEIKRILPIEILGSGFFSNLPITKSDIDLILPDLKEYIERSAIMASAQE